MYGFTEEEEKDSDIWRFILIKSDYNHEPTYANAHSTVQKLHKNANFQGRIQFQKRAGILAKHAFDLQ
jgi:hypothetical protein